MPQDMLAKKQEGERNPLTAVLFFTARAVLHVLRKWTFILYRVMRFYFAVLIIFAGTEYLARLGFKK